MNDNVIDLFGHNKKNDASFGAVAEEWLSSLRPELRESTVMRYRDLLDSYIYLYLKDINIESLTRKDVEFVCSRLLETGRKDNKGLSPKSVKLCLTVIKDVFEYASLNKNVNIPNLRNIKIEQEYKPMRILTITEHTKLDRYLKSDPTPTNVGIWLCLNTGIRLGEICALKWKDINLPGGYIYIKETAQRIRQEGDKKTKLSVLELKDTGARRKVPVTRVMCEVLRRNKSSENAYILTGDTKILDPRTLINRFKKVLERVEIPYASFNALRNTFAVRCVEAGTDIKILSEILGHANAGITMDRYIHPTMEEMTREMNKLSDVFSNE